MLMLTTIDIMICFLFQPNLSHASEKEVSSKKKSETKSLQKQREGRDVHVDEHSEPAPLKTSRKSTRRYEKYIIFKLKIYFQGIKHYQYIIIL